MIKRIYLASKKKWLSLSFTKKCCAALVGVVCLFSVLFVVYGQVMKTGKIQTDELSERAKEFIEEQKKQSASSWKTVDVQGDDASPKAQTPSAMNTPCFTLSLPFEVRYVKPSLQLPCSAQARITQNGVRLTLTVESWDKPLDEHSAVNMRMKDIENFSPLVYASSAFPTSLTFSSKESISFFAKQEDEILMVVLSETQYPTKLFPATLDTIIQAVQLIPKDQRVMPEVTNTEEQ